MSKVNTQMTFAVILTLAFIFYPVIGYSHPHDEFDYFGEPHGYDSVYDYDLAPQTVPQYGGVRITHPSQSFPEWDRIPPPFGPENRDWPLVLPPPIYGTHGTRGLDHWNPVDLVPWGLSAWEATGRAGKWFSRGNNALGLFWADDIGPEPLIQPMPPPQQGWGDFNRGSRTRSSSRGSRTRSSSDMWEAGKRIRGKKLWRDSVHRRDWANTRPGEDKFQRANRLNYGPQTRAELNIAPYTPIHPPNQTKREPLEN